MALLMYVIGVDPGLHGALAVLGQDGWLAVHDTPTLMLQTSRGSHTEYDMPGMARLLHRPAYDFSRSYDYNRSQFAIGCYHCHMVN